MISRRRRVQMRRTNLSNRSTKNRRSSRGRVRLSVCLQNATHCLIIGSGSYQVGISEPGDVPRQRREFHGVPSFWVPAISDAAGETGRPPTAGRAAGQARLCTTVQRAGCAVFPTGLWPREERSPNLDRKGFLRVLLVLSHSQRVSPIRTDGQIAQLLISAQQLQSFNRPTKCERQSVLNYMQNPGPVYSEEVKFALCKEDLITLRAGREHAWLDRAIERVLRKLHWGPFIRPLEVSPMFLCN